MSNPLRPTWGYSGGWGYYLGGPATSEMEPWVVFALQAAEQKVGATVPAFVRQEFVPRGVDYAEVYYQTGLAAQVVYQPAEAILNLWGQSRITAPSTADSRFAWGIEQEVSG